jgi:hypothetical protein
MRMRMPMPMPMPMRVRVRGPDMGRICSDGCGVTDAG